MQKSRGHGSGHALAFLQLRQVPALLFHQLHKGLDRTVLSAVQLPISLCALCVLCGKWLLIRDAS
jgi:hypothetical protein